MPKAKTKTKPGRSKYTNRPIPHKQSARPVPPHPRDARETSPTGAKVEVEIVSEPRMMYRLYAPMIDKASGLKGILTHYYIDLDGSRKYRFQPHGVNTEDGSPNKGVWIPSASVDCKEMVPEPDKLPFHVLGTEVTDIGSGFSGKVVAIVLHESGCVHCTVQAMGKHPKTGGLIDMEDFDIRRLEGPAIKKMTPEEREADQNEKPSPSGFESTQPRDPGVL